MPRFAVIALTCLVVGGCGGKSGAEERLAQGETVYVRECARCHMTDGSGVARVYPNLAGNPIVRLDSPEPVIDIVLHGREAMPAFEAQIPTQKVAAVITYIRGAWGNRAGPVTPAMAK